MVQGLLLIIMIRIKQVIRFDVMKNSLVYILLLQSLFLVFFTSCNNKTNSILLVTSDIIDEVPSNLIYERVDTSFNNIDYCYLFMNRNDIFHGTHYSHWNMIKDKDTLSNYIKIYPKVYESEMEKAFFYYAKEMIQTMDVSIIDIELSRERSYVKLGSRDMFIYKKNFLVDGENLEVFYEAIDLRNGIDIDFHVKNSSFLDKY